MNTNQEIAKIFDQMADLLEMKDVAWKPRAYRAGARSLENSGKNVRDIYAKGGLKALEDIPGIGEGLGKKIVEYLRTGKIPEYEKLKRSLPAGLPELMAVPGVGPYRAENLYHHHIYSLDDLKKAVQSHELSRIPGFGLQSEKILGENLGVAHVREDRWPRSEVLPVARHIVAALRRSAAVELVRVVGSLRRKEPTIGDIDLLVISHRGSEVMGTFVGLPEVEKVLAHGDKKSEVILKNGLQVDLRVFEPESLGAALLYFTGNKHHNIELRKRAIRRGYKLNEYGLFDPKGNRLAGATEEQVYRKLGLRYIPPEDRSDHDEFEKYQL